jgi:ubiquinone/menaquinone biosynthesis C-methylase UbiE
MDPSNKYTIMQKEYYDNEGTTGRMNRENHMPHNKNPDYWNILVKDTEDPSFLNKVGLDFGCGCGRNVLNLYERFKRMDGVDISPELISTCKTNMENHGIDTNLYNFYTCNGIDLSIINDETYDFVMSTIVLQHICVHDIRYNYLKEFYRIMKPSSILSFQMGFGTNHNSTSDYYDNFYDATKTNSGQDVRVTNPNDIINELKEIGFTNITHVISHSWNDLHDQWIFIRAEKS